MIKLFILIIVVTAVDLKGVSYKKNKKEIIIYVVMCLITIGVGFYYNDPNHISINELILNLTK